MKLQHPATCAQLNLSNMCLLNPNTSAQNPSKPHPITAQGPVSMVYLAHLRQAASSLPKLMWQKAMSNSTYTAAAQQHDCDAQPHAV